MEKGTEKGILGAFGKGKNKDFFHFFPGFIPSGFGIFWGGGKNTGKKKKNRKVKLELDPEMDPN